jgi:hypothetical protein
MTPEQQAAYINAQAACALAEIAAMQAANASRPGTHSASEFEDLIQKYGIHHNAVLSFFHGR